MQMTKSDAWRLMYRQDRYMSHLTDKELEVRIQELLSNMTILTDEGKIGLHVKDRAIEGEYWMTLWTHALEEMFIRHGEFPSGFTNGFIKTTPIVKPTYPAEPTALQAISKIGGRKPGDLYKFGRKEHLRRALALGAIRIAPASMYNDPSLNRAIRDDELSLSITMRPGQVRIRRPDSTIAPFGNIRINFAARTNFFVFCTASKYTLREYDDFEADSCLVIRDPRKLIRKMLAAVKRQHPEMDGFACPVTYVDPLNADPSQMEVMTCKHFRYAYQNEYRIVWVPRSPTKILVPFEIDIGDMSDYAHLIEIP